MFRLPLSVAKHLLEISEHKANQMGLRSVIAIVDEGGNLIALHRMDNARIAGIDIAMGKAWTSVAMQMPTANLAQSALPGEATFGINTTNQGKLVILGGGIPLVRDNNIIGGIGVSGGTSMQDIEVANAAVQTLASYSNVRVGPMLDIHSYPY